MALGATVYFGIRTDRSIASTSDDIEAAAQEDLAEATEKITATAQANLEQATEAITTSARESVRKMVEEKLKLPDTL